MDHDKGAGNCTALGAVGERLPSVRDLAPNATTTKAATSFAPSAKPAQGTWPPSTAFTDSTIAWAWAVEKYERLQ